MSDRSGESSAAQPEESPAARQVIAEGPENLAESVQFDRLEDPDYSNPQMFGEYYAVWDSGKAAGVDIRRASDNGLRLRIDSPGKKRNISRVIVKGESAYVIDSPNIDEFEEAPSVLYKVDLASGKRLKIPPPAGRTWSAIGSIMDEAHGDLWWKVDEVDHEAEVYTSCLVRIRDDSAELMYCPEEKNISFVRESDLGVSMLILPKTRQDDAACTEQVEFNVRTKEVRRIGSGDPCHAYTGMSFEGWDLWHERSARDPHYYSETELLADGPNGERLSFGLAATGTVRPCGGRVYWWTRAQDGDRSGRGDHLMEWVPGETTTTIVAKNSPGGFAKGANCANGFLTWRQIFTEGPFIGDASYYINLNR